MPLSALSNTRCLLIVQDTACVCGNHWVSSSLIFRSDQGYSYDITPAREQALKDKTLLPEARRYSKVFLPICYKCSYCENGNWRESTDKWTDPPVTGKALLPGKKLSSSPSLLTESLLKDLL